MIRTVSGPRVSLAGLIIATVGSGLAMPILAAEPAVELPGISVAGEREAALVVNVDPQDTPQTRPNTAELLRRTPGGNVNTNGPLSGIAHYRGMYSYRVSTKVDGVPITPGGPNWMDAPLHYAPMPLLQALELQRGIAPVSAGGETIGGQVRAERWRSQFGGARDFEFHGGLNASAQSVDDGYGLGAMLAASNDTHRFHALGVREDGDDSEYADGDIVPTEYERGAWGLGYGLALGEHAFGVDYLRNETDDAGTPALPMDIRYVDTDIVSTDYRGRIGSVELSGRYFYTDVDHLMDNYALRGAPQDPARYRYTLADGETRGFDLAAAVPVASGELGFGIDGEYADHDADIFNPNNPMFFVNNINDVSRDRTGGYLEWSARFGQQWTYQLGARYNRVEADAGLVDGTPAMMNPAAQSLRDQFNGSDRNLDWDIYDVVAKLFYQLTPTVRVDFGLAQKQRAPSYQELYLWLPMQATAGLADGKNYIGNLDLDEERASVVELGLEWRSAAAFIAPRVFYQQVDDYIQGTPTDNQAAIMFSSMMGDPTPLQFNNVDAKLYGIDADFGWQLLPRWSVDGVLSYVRGERRDINDDLYRIPPLTGIVGLSFTQDRWSATAEGMFAAEQNEVSATNEESETDGYGIFNLFGSYRWRERMTLSGGVNNLFDKVYRDHTNGINRVADSDVAVGDRLPGPGRSLFARLNYRW